MSRSILAIIVGCVVTAAIVIVGSLISFFVFSKNGMFKEGTYELTPMWLAIGFALALIAAMLGGCVCALIAPAQRRSGTVKVLAAVVLVAGILFAIPKFSADYSTPPPPRTGNESFTELASHSREPRIATILHPIIGAVGVLIGGSLVRRNTTAR